MTEEQIRAVVRDEVKRIQAQERVDYILAAREPSVEAEVRLACPLGPEDEQDVRRKLYGSYDAAVSDELMHFRKIAAGGREAI